MSLSETGISAETVQSVNPEGASSVVLVCEHASHFIPDAFDHLGLAPELRRSHVVWDPGAMGVARHLSHRLDAALVAGGVSRLVYDCNRPPDADGAMPSRSEIIDIPGNVSLTKAQRAERVRTYYQPFHAALAEQISRTSHPAIVTIHSFTPVYHGQIRSVEIGVLHDRDTRLSDALLECAPAHTNAEVNRNQPYGREDGVMHTLKEHALPKGYLNVMLELRNDLIETETQQEQMSRMLAGWLQDAFARTGADGVVECVA